MTSSVLGSCHCRHRYSVTLNSVIHLIGLTFLLCWSWTENVKQPSNSLYITLVDKTLKQTKLWALSMGLFFTIAQMNWDSSRGTDIVVFGAFGDFQSVEFRFGVIWNLWGLGYRVLCLIQCDLCFVIHTSLLCLYGNGKFSRLRLQSRWEFFLTNLLNLLTLSFQSQ